MSVQLSTENAPWALLRYQLVPTGQEKTATAQYKFLVERQESIEIDQRFGVPFFVQKPS